MSYVAWAATAVILVTYFAAPGKPFHWANFIGALILAPINASLGAWQAVVLNAAFGLIALQHLVRRHRAVELTIEQLQ